ncbi:MAG TPA: folate-binding protein [Burkholderiaceae bacterium]|nr:folate-binding protein [Burkholderiaceae bacterium]
MPEDPRPGTPEGAWSAPVEQLQRALREPLLTALPRFGVLAVRGPDAAQFLNAQLTVDVAAIDATRWQLGAYCSIKGRVTALVELWRTDDGFCLSLPSEMVETLRSRLARFVLRSKVQLENVTDQWRAFGLTGLGIEHALTSAGLPCPEQPWTSRPLSEGGRLVRVPPSPRAGARLMLLTPAATTTSYQQKLAAVTPVDPGVWWWSKVDAGLPDVFTVTQERFLPQMLNLDVLGGVHFGKGCYPGQEVVARSQYLGKLRRRMMRAHAAQALPGEDVFDDSADGASGGAVGTVVMAAASPEGGVDLLLECPTALVGAAQLRIGKAQSGHISLGEVPYPMINPTA